MSYASLTEFLEQTNTKQSDFAARVGVSQPVISRIVNGHAVPRLALALRIAAEADIPVESLLIAQDSSSQPAA